MQSSIDERVYDLVAKERGMGRAKLRPSTTLSHDLGMEGDDAVEFFEALAAKFAVDLQPLGKDWPCYFAAEGVGLGTMMLVSIPSLIAAYLIRLAAPVVPLWLALLFGFIAMVAILAFWVRKRPAKGPQISIQDLVDCVNAGRWNKQLPSDRWSYRKVIHVIDLLT